MSFKKLISTILFLCLFLSVKHYARSENMLEQFKELHLQKKWLTDQQFEEKKKAIIESHSPAAKKRAAEEAKLLAEEAKLLAEKQKQEKILEDEASKEYANKYPLHFAIKNKDLQAVKRLLSSPNPIINQIDSEGNTPWDVALDKEQPKPESLGELRKAFSEITAPLSINLQAGINYKMGGFQTAVNETFALQKKIKARYPLMLSLLSELGETISSTKSLIGSSRSDLLAVWINSTNTMVSDFLKYGQPVLQFTKTDISGKATFQNILPGDYVIIGMTPTRSGISVWFTEVNVTSSSPNLFFDEKNAIILF